ncbi:MAG: AMIN domain-containing protein, partial [Planctomycetota bacterium]
MAVALVVTLGGCASAKDRIGDASGPPVLGSKNGASIIERVEVSKGDQKTTIRAVANQAIRYFAIRQEEPPAVILNLTGTRIAAPIAPIEIKNDLVDTVFVSQTSSKGSASRILVTLRTDAHYEIHPRPDGLVIEVSATAAADDPAVDAGAPSGQASVAGVIDDTPIAGGEDTAAEVAPAKALVDVRVDKGGDGTEIALELDGRPAQYESSTLSDPSRLVVDLHGISEASGKRQIAVGTAEVDRVRVGRHPDRVRVVLDLADDEARYAIEPDGSRLVIALGRRSAALAGRIAPAGADDTTRIEEGSKPQAIAEAGDSRDVSAQERAEPESSDDTVGAGVSAEESAPVRPSEDPVVKSLLADLKPSDPVMPPSTPIVAALDTPGTADDDTITGDESMSDYVTERPEISLGFRPGKIYHGNLISLDFKDADIQNILRLIAEVSGLNVVAGDDVEGKVTVRLVNVPWDQALDVVLASRKLGYIKTGNIIRVAPAERLKSEEAQYLADRRSKEKLQDLVVKLQ